MAKAVTILSSGGVAVTNTFSPQGLPVTPVNTGGMAVTLVSAGGLPMSLVDESGSPFFNFGGLIPYNYWDFTRNRALIAGADVGPVTASPGWTVSGGSLVMDSSGLLVTTQTITCTANVTGAYTAFVEFVRATDTGALEVYLQAFFDANNLSSLRVGAADAPSMSVRTAGAVVAAPAIGTVAAGAAVHKLAGRVSAGDFNAAFDATLGTQDTSGALPTAPATFQFGSNNGASFSGAGNYIRRAAIFNSALTDAQLQTITT